MDFDQITDLLLRQFHAHSNQNRPYIVGVDGLGGAGKSTLLKKIVHGLNDNNCEVTSFHLDDHIVEKNLRYETGYEEWYEYYYLQWDIAHLTSNLFDPLYSGCKQLEVPYYMKTMDTISIRQIKVKTDSIVLVEGIFLQREQWRKYFDFVIYLHCPFELRRERVMNRDLYIGDYQTRLRKYKKRYWMGENHYLNIENPMKKADLIIRIK